MGEKKRQGELKGMVFNRSVRVEARPTRLSDNGGALLLREAMERLGVLASLDAVLVDPRDPKRITHPQKELLATYVTLLALGWRDQDDADALRKDPVLRLAVSERAGDSPLRDDSAFVGDPNPPVPQGISSQPTLSRLLHRLADEEPVSRLRELPREVSVRRNLAMNRGHRLASVTADFDPMDVPVSGAQPGSAYHGYYRDTVYLPMITSCAETGDIVSARLRRGTAPATEDALEYMLEDLRWMRKHLSPSVSARFDAALPCEPVLAGLENERFPYVSRLRGNAVLDRMAQPYLTRPVGRPPALARTWVHELEYKAESWSRARRVVLVVLERPGELLLHHFWLVTSWRADKVDAEMVLERYRRRGKAEGHMGEFKHVLGLKLSSSPRGAYSANWREHLIGPVRPCDDPFFRANDVQLQLNALAYNAMHALRGLLDDGAPEGEGWSLQRLRERVLRVATRVSLHGRRVIVTVTDATARYWRTIWDRWGLLDTPELGT